MKQKGWKYVWHWLCDWDNNRGMYDPDCEYCGAHDKSGFDSMDAAITAASKHRRKMHHGSRQHVWRERKYCKGGAK